MLVYVGCAMGLHTNLIIIIIVIKILKPSITAPNSCIYATIRWCTVVPNNVIMHDYSCIILFL